MKCKCSKCKKVYHILNDDTPYMIKKKIVCSDCFFEVVGDFIEKNPIGVRGNWVLPKTAKELHEQFNKDLQYLQDHCKHKSSEWMEEWWAVAHPTGYQVKICNLCEKLLDRKGKCSECGCIIKDKNVAKIGDTWLGYCKKCSPKINRRNKNLEKKFNEIEKKEKTKHKKRR